MIRPLIVFFFSLPLFLIAESDNHGGTTETGTSKTGKRLAAEGKLSEEAVKFLASHFFRTEEIIKKDFETAIPAAIEKAIQNKDEAQIAEILATLVATVPPKQADVIITDAKKEIENETKDKDPGKFDTRYVALMERILWAAMNRNGQVNNEAKANDFNKAFKDPYIKARDFAKLANEKLKQAADGNAEAKDWVSKNVRMDTALTLAEGQRKVGEKALSDNLIKGVSFKIGDQRVLDMWGPGREPQRLYLGNTDASLSTAVDSFLNDKKSFGTNVVARKELPNNKALKSWVADGSGKIKPGFPAGFEPKEEPPPPPPNQPPPTQVNTDINLVRNALNTGRCNGTCHALELRGSSILDAVLVTPSASVALRDFPTRFNNPSDPMAGPMRTNPAASSTRQQFEEFARIQRGAQQ